MSVILKVSVLELWLSCRQAEEPHEVSNHACCCVSDLLLHVSRRWVETTDYDNGRTLSATSD